MSQARSIGNAILDVENVSLAFGGVKALASVSFDVLEGEVRAIIGPNGAGKSSMLNCINGFYKPTEGTITFKGQSHQQMKTHEAASQGIRFLDQCPLGPLGLEGRKAPLETARRS